MATRIEIKSETAGELDTFYHWLKDKRPELLEIDGLRIQRAKARMMGMPGKTVIKIIYEGPDRVPAEVGQKLEEWRKVVAKHGGSLTLQEAPTSLLGKIRKRLGLA